MLRFILAQNLTDEVTDVVTDNVTFWSWDTIVKYFEDSFPTVLDFLVKLVIAIIVLLVGRKVIKLVRKFIRKFLNKTNWDEGVKQFLDNMCNVGLHFVLIMLVLGKFGITASSVIAVIGSVGLSVGLALQGTLSNFAGGVLKMCIRDRDYSGYLSGDESRCTSPGYHAECRNSFPGKYLFHDYSGTGWYAGWNSRKGNVAFVRWYRQPGGRLYDRETWCYH